MPHIHGRSIRCTAVVALLMVLFPVEDSAGQRRQREAGGSALSVIPGEEQLHSRSSSEQTSSGNAGGSTAERWSIGVRVNWNSFRSAPIDIDRRYSQLVQCPVENTCLPPTESSAIHGRSRSDPGISPSGIMLDAGAVVAAGLEIGVGVDVLSYADPVTLSLPSHAETAIPFQDVALGDRVQQLDLAGRVTYTFGGVAGRRGTLVGGGRRLGPYVGIGAGVSRYSLRPLEGNHPGHRMLPAPLIGTSPEVSSLGTDGTFQGWAPNVQGYVGATMRIVPWMPVVDVDFRYVQLVTRGIGLGSFRFATGFRYLF